VDGSPFNSTARRMDDSVLAPYPVEAVPQSNREIRLEVNQSQPTVWVLESALPECQSLHLDIPADGRAILGRRGNPSETSRRDSCREIAARGKAGVYGKNKKMQQSHPLTPEPQMG